MECGCGELAKVFEGGQVTTMETSRNTISKSSGNATGINVYSFYVERPVI